MPRPSAKSPNGKPSPAKGIGGSRVASWSVAVFFLGAVATQTKLQTVDRAKVKAEAHRVRADVVSVVDSARRGAILAQNGAPLAEDSQATELSVNFRKVPRSDAFYVDLAAATGIAATEFRDLVMADARSKSWMIPLSPAQSDAVAMVRSRWRADGVSVAKSERRSYPLEEAAACLVGQIRYLAGMGEAGKPGWVRTGLESSVNNDLAGKDGRRVGLTDRRGRFLPNRIIESEGIKREDGQDVRLTVDADLQVAAFQAVRSVVDKYQATSGVAIVMEPGTGNVLAMANYPSFTPVEGARNDGRNPGGFNPAYMAVYEPGSMFKILTLAKRIDIGDFDIHAKINCQGTLYYNRSWRIRCDEHHGNRAHHAIDAETAIAKSCNVSAATWALKIGYPEMVKYMEELGLMDRTGIEVSGEQRGQFNYKEYAKPLQLMTMGFGQSMACTPLSLAAAFNTIANGGVRVGPRLIDRIGGTLEPAAPTQEIVSQATADEVMEAMVRVIQSDEGTGKTLRIPGYELAGKTGTAEKQGHTTGRRQYVSNFVGFVPARNPRATVLVMIDNPKSAYYGATVAGPAFKSIAEAVIKRYNIPPNGATRADSYRAVAMGASNPGAPRG